MRYDKRLPNGAKLLYGDICGLTNKFGYCFATNGYFAEMFSCTDITISNWISKLKKYGYIEVNYNPTGGYLSKRKRSKARQVAVSDGDWLENRTATDEYYIYGWISTYYDLQFMPGGFKISDKDKN